MKGAQPMKKFLALMLSAVLIMSLGTTALAVDTEKEINEDAYTVSAPANSLGTSSGSGAKISYEIGHGSGEWSKLFSWARAKTEAYGWATATYLYARATVTADGCTAQTETKSTTTNQSVKTDKIYQSQKAGRTLSTYHIVKGYWGDETTLKTETYSGTYSW